jgi:hypothetical protein
MLQIGDRLRIFRQLHPIAGTLLPEGAFEIDFTSDTGKGAPRAPGGLRVIPAGTAISRRPSTTCVDRRPCGTAHPDSRVVDPEELARFSRGAASVELFERNHRLWR